MATYRVTWVIDVEADNRYDAATQARAFQLDPESIALVFDVKDMRTLTTETLDLLGIEENN